jgi:hypothetical protein
MTAGPDDWYAPNQQAVRGDESGPAEEGEGNTERIDPEPVQPAEQPNLDEMTKAELLEHAASLGVDVDESATKADIRAVIEQAS